jgi:hypothetical protein
MCIDKTRLIFFSSFLGQLEGQATVPIRLNFVVNQMAISVNGQALVIATFYFVAFSEST